MNFLCVSTRERAIIIYKWDEWSMGIGDNGGGGDGDDCVMERPSTASSNWDTIIFGLHFRPLLLLIHYQS